jgi:hypothetical protein
VIFAAGGRRDTASFLTAARYSGGVVPERPVRAGGVLVGGPHTAESAGQLNVRDKVVLFVPPPQANPAGVQQVLRVLFLGGTSAVVILGEADSATFASSVPKHYSERTVIGLPASRPVMLQVQVDAVKGALAAAGVNLDSVRGAPAPVFRDLPRLKVGVEISDSITSAQTAPNTIGILEGSDPQLKKEYLV